MDNQKIYQYKFKRDAWQKEGNKFRAAFYQLLIVREIEKSIFSWKKKKDLVQHKFILSTLMDDILGSCDKYFQISIYHEMVLSNEGIGLPCNKKIYEEYRNYVKANKSNEYIYEVYQLHLNCIMEIAATDIEAAKKYADNLLTLLELRYGIQSWQYAKMKLHILGEFFCDVEKEVFINLMKNQYDYFEYYLLMRDDYLYEAIIIFVYYLDDSSDKDYNFWLEKCEAIIEQKRGDGLYCYFKCKIVWLRAKDYGKQMKFEKALDLLNEVIVKYIPDKIEIWNPIYAFIYLEAAYDCYNMKQYSQMYLYSQEGIGLCEKYEQKESEIYYNLYNNIGLYYITNNEFGAAEELYSSCIKDIEEKYGKESENYVLYLGNLTLTFFKQGKSAYSFIRELKQIKSRELRKKFKGIFNNVLNCTIANGDSIGNIKRVYQQCIQTLDDEDTDERIRLDVLYLSAAVEYGNADDTDVSSLLRKLFKLYANDFKSELAFLYWNSFLIWKWKIGDLQGALKISEKIFSEIEEMAELEYLPFRVNYIQLLIMDGQKDKSKEQILLVIDLLSDKILDTGFGNIFNLLFYVRVLLSMYIYASRGKEGEIQLKEDEAKLLLEKIVFCKTVEKEIKSILGKYHEGDDEMDFYYFRKAHGKLAALELRLQLGNLGSPAIYKENRQKCILEMAEHESNLNNKIAFYESVNVFRFEDMDIPPKAVCIEYFAYYELCFDIPVSSMFRDKSENLEYSYLMFVLSGSKEHGRILDVENISLGWTEEDDLCFLSMMEEKPEKDRKADKGNLEQLYQLFAVPILKFFENKEILYLGLDYLLQMIPFDLIFKDREGNIAKILMTDSVFYVEEDTWINMRESEALIIGNPKYRIKGEQMTPSLPGGEMECRRIAELFKTKAYLGAEAKQKVLWRDRPGDILHIATHGDLLDKAQKAFLQDNLFIDYYLMFAGFEDWLVGEKDRDCGNGLMAGDDFLFMDLSQTKLVVLSACGSNLGLSRGLEHIHGIRWAIGAAGAKNSVTSLWEVSDCATGVLMIMLYRNLQEMPVGEALYEAKMRLRDITVAELKKDNVLYQISEKDVRKCADNEKPFKNWKYWAAFVCYQR